MQQISIKSATSTGEHIAIYSVLSVDILGRSVQLQVLEEGQSVIQNLYYINFLALSQFTPMSVFASRQRRALVADTLSDHRKSVPC